MRQQLLKGFDAVCILDLHGGAKKKRVAPDGSRDENVFGTVQGGAVCIVVKLPRER